MPKNPEPTRRDDDPDAGLTERQTYNLISDTLVGVNVRPKDNVIQALAIIVCLALGAGIGALVGEERVVGAMVGGVLGLMVGCFGSGIALMIYRAVMHARGKHD